MGIFADVGSVAHGEYTVRVATPDDVDGFLGLHREVFGTWPPAVDREVFEWKYTESPYFDELPVVVATRDGAVVGAMGHVGCELRVGDETFLGVQPGDLMVHPDHRRSGVHRTMMQLDEDLGDGDELFFGFPGKVPSAGYRQRGRRLVENPIYVRPLSPGDGGDHGHLRRTGRRLGVGAVRGFASLMEALRPVDEGVTVTRAADPSIDLLVSLYWASVPPGIHVERTRPFYAWRVRDPLDDFATYLVRAGGTVAAAVVASERDGTVFVRDVLPYDAGGGAVRAALSAIAADYRDCEYLCSWCPASMDAASLWSSGLVSSRLLPRLSYSTDLVTRAHEGRWSVAGRRLDDPDDWDVHLLARDY